MTRDELTRAEKVALVTVGAASAYNVLLWSLGHGLAASVPGLTPLGVLRVAFAVVSFVSMDLVVIVTVMAMRAGRRGIWSEAAAGSAALAAGLIALEVAGVVAWPWLHAAPAVVLYAFMRHVAQPVTVTSTADTTVSGVDTVDTVVSTPDTVVSTPDTARTRTHIAALAQQYGVSERTIRRRLKAGAL